MAHLLQASILDSYLGYLIRGFDTLQNLSRVFLSQRLLKERALENSSQPYSICVNTAQQTLTAVTGSSRETILRWTKPNSTHLISWQHPVCMDVTMPQDTEVMYSRNFLSQECGLQRGQFPGLTVMPPRLGSHCCRPLRCCAHRPGPALSTDLGIMWQYEV